VHEDYQLSVIRRHVIYTTSKLDLDRKLEPSRIQRSRKESTLGPLPNFDQSDKSQTYSSPENSPCGGKNSPRSSNLVLPFRKSQSLPKQKMRFEIQIPKKKKMSSHSFSRAKAPRKSEQKSPKLSQSEKKVRFQLS